MFDLKASKTGSGKTETRGQRSVVREKIQESAYFIVVADGVKVEQCR
jgi:hypothetical protein